MEFKPYEIPLPLVDGDTLFIDNSTLERFVTCPRSAGYYVGQKRELNRSRAALEFGKIIHQALAVRYANFPGYVSNECVAAMVKALDAGFVNYKPDDDEWRNYGIAVSAIQHYNSTYPMEDFDIVQLEGRPFVERPFALPLGEISIDADLFVRGPDGTVSKRHVQVLKIVWKGRIDLALRRETRLYGMDHKTTSVMGPGYFSEFELSHQVHGYSWALRKLLGSLPSGFIINGLGIRKPTKSGKALEYVRTTIPIYASLVDEWELDTLHIVSDFVEMCRRGYLPKHTKWCVAKYGACEYKQVCGLEPDMRATAIGSNEYRQVTWDPLKDE